MYFHGRAFLPLFFFGQLFPPISEYGAGSLWNGTGGAQGGWGFAGKRFFWRFELENIEF